ncbi:hypothetical protein [Natronomonas sp. EA1]|uniref:hypothetical protein n=1 Tax=Natronomonas sp. EA1 TaxID=3421655 RepID=UPI003EBB096F
MRNRFLLFGVLATVLLASVAPVSAQSDSSELDLDSLVSTYNANLDQAPDIAKGQLAGKRVELRVGEGSTLATADTGTAYHFTTNDDGAITEYGEGDATNPQIRVRTSEATMNDVLTADDPGKAFNEAYENGEIEISGLTFTEGVKVELVKFAVWVGKLLGFL